MIFKKEKAVIELILRHIETTRKCVESAMQVVRAYAAGEVADSKDLLSEVNRLESEADGLLREIRDMLYSGAYLPQMRGDIYGLMSAIDKITNRAEDCFDHFHYQNPVIPAEFREEIGSIIELTLECFEACEKALRAYFGPKDKIRKVRKQSVRVSELESQIDENERETTAKIFDSSLDKAEKLHLRRSLMKITRISDATEDATDRLQWVSVKSIV